jgi:hypothetical protein
MKQIKDYPDYLATLDGRVFSLKSMKFIKPLLINSGYFLIRLRNNFKEKSFLLHRVIASTYIENVDNKEQVNHIDGNKINNCVLNLQWNTSCENMKHAYDNNLIKLSDKKIKACSENGKTKGRYNLVDKSKLVLDEINGIYYNSLTEVARIIGVSHRTLSDKLTGKIKNNTNFKYV